MNKSTTVDRIRRSGIVPVIRVNSEDLVKGLVDAIFEGGIRICEITMTVPNALGLIRKLVDDFGDEAVIGAGTVLDADTALRCIETGAQFLVSPVFENGVVDVCKNADCAAFPGALSPSEILNAWRSGADAVKVFPAPGVGGPSYLKAIKGPFPDIELMPSGGVTLATIGEYIRAGAIAAGVGGDLTDVVAIKEGRAQDVTRTARAFVKAIEEARSLP